MIAKFTKIWDAICDVGHQDQISFESKRDLRLVNGMVFVISVIIFILLLIVILPLIASNGINGGASFVLARNILLIFIGGIVFYLNHIHHYQAAKYTAIIFYYFYFYLIAYFIPRPIFSELFPLIWLCLVYLNFKRGINFIFTAVGLFSNIIIVYHLHETYPETYSPFNSVLTQEVVGFIILSICLSIFRSEREIYLKIIEIKNHHLISQKEKLQILNESLQKANEFLDTRVQTRTKELIQINDELLHYHVMNAHQITAPLARITGLVNLLNYINSSEEQKDLLKKLTEAAHELDQVTDEIRETLENAEERAEDTGKNI